MPSVGERLRRARLDRHLRIDDLSASTKINARFLEAIESDRRDQIPAGFFFKHWALQYAQALSVDPAEIQDGIDRVLDAEPPLPLPGQLQAESRDLPQANRDSGRRQGTPPMLLSFAVLLSVVLVCSGFYAWWRQQQHSDPAATVAASAPVVPGPVRPAEPGDVRTISKPVEVRVPAKRAAVDGQLPKRPTEIRKVSRKRVKAKKLKRASSPALRASTRGEE